MTDEVRIYETELPPADDPDVVALADEMIAAARQAQRPGRALAVAAPGLLVGVVLWGELNRLTGFDMPWLAMAASAVVLGALLGLPFRLIGQVFDRRWALTAGALGLAMAVLGDLHAWALIQSNALGMGWAEVMSHFDPGAWLGARLPIDWLVAGLGAAGAFMAARPKLDGRQLGMEARIETHMADLAEERLEDEARAAEENIEGPGDAEAHAPEGAD